MKQLFIFLLALFIGLGLPQDASAKDRVSGMRLAMISDYGGITDQSFNQTIYEACKTYAQSHGIPFTCFQPVNYTNEERAKIVDEAANQGYNVIIAPGDTFAVALKTKALAHPEVSFVSVDVTQEELGNYMLPKNFYCVSYREELSGYMAGYAAVKLGYTRLGYLGGMDVPAVKRYGYGFVQGVNEAAKELGTADVSLNYLYAGQFDPDDTITDAMSQWYKDGTQIVFACGGGVYESVAEAAEPVKGKIIGVDVDQSGVIDFQYGKGMTVTSAMKDLSGAVRNTLSSISNGTFHGGKIETLGLVSPDPGKNYVKLPMGTTQWNERFTQKDYQALVASMFKGKIKVSGDISKQPSDFAANITLKNLGKLHR